VAAGVKRWQEVLVAVVVVGLVPFAAADSRDPGHRSPALILADGMPDDLRDLVRGTWDRFAESFPARVDCIDPVTVQGYWELDDRATYDPGRGVVAIRIPGTAPNLRASLIHEFAHHLEFTCPAQRAIRSRFLLAQGLPREAPWFDGATWERTPSEHWAEVVVEFVVEHRPAHARITATTDALNLLRGWAR
jgi:hypothetical protein